MHTSAFHPWTNTYREAAIWQSRLVARLQIPVLQRHRLVLVGPQRYLHTQRLRQIHRPVSEHRPRRVANVRAVRQRHTEPVRRRQLLGARRRTRAEPRLHNHLHELVDEVLRELFDLTPIRIARFNLRHFLDRLRGRQVRANRQLFCSQLNW